MRLRFKTEVSGSVQKVFAGFDRKLFAALSPRWVQTEIKRFDGCFIGDEVHLKLPLGDWVSLITAREESEMECFFVDEGKLLPAPFVCWRHRHVVRSEMGLTWIVDEIEFKTSSKLLDVLFWPILGCLFKARAPIYRRYFAE